MSAEQGRDHGRAIGAAAARDDLVCPFCESRDAELHSLFGNMQLVSQYYCRGCNSVFEAVLWQEPPGGEDARPPHIPGA